MFIIIGPAGLIPTGLQEATASIKNVGSVDELGNYTTISTKINTLNKK